MQLRHRQRVRRSGNRCVQCAIGDFIVSLRSDLPEVLDDFMSLYPPRSVGASDPNRTIQLEVRKAGRSRLGRRLYRVFADGQEVGGWRTSNGVFPLLEWGINLRIMATRSEFLQLHAASMSYRGYGVVFAGDSGCGKSTLAAILLSRGWNYLCDEFALVDPHAIRLHPFPKALCIKQGSYPVVRQLGLPFARRRDYLKELKGRVGYINPRALEGNAVVAPAPVRFIVFPQYRSKTRPRLEPVCRSHATMKLFRSCLNRHAFSDAALGALTALARQSQCFRLDSGRPEETGRLLESMLDASHARDDTARIPPIRPTSDRPSVRDRSTRLKSRRDMLRVGVKLAYVTPSILTVTAQQAFAAGSNPSDICSTGLNVGELCETDSDCCSEDCDFGLCQ